LEEVRMGDEDLALRHSIQLGKLESKVKRLETKLDDLKAIVEGKK